LSVKSLNLGVGGSAQNTVTGDRSLVEPLHSKRFSNRQIGDFAPRNNTPIISILDIRLNNPTI